MAKWNKVGSLRRGKTGSLYMKIDADIKSGANVQLQDPRKSIQAGVEAGRIEEGKAEEMLAKVPEYILYDLFVVTDKE